MNSAIRRKMHLSYKAKSYLTVLGTSLIYFAMGLYFAAGNTGVYLTSYLIYRAGSDMRLDDAIWFLSAAGFSALLLPLGGWLESRIGVRGVCALGGLLQSCGIFASHWVLDTTFFWLVVVYGGSFLVSLASCYTSPLVNVCKWHPRHKGLVTGIGAASMALAPTLFTPLITALVNPDNLPANKAGLFEDAGILDRTKNSMLIQGAITGSLFLLGIALTFPAEPAPTGDNEADRGRLATSKRQPVALTHFRKLPDATGALELTSGGQGKELSGEQKVGGHLFDAEAGRGTEQVDTSAGDCSLEPRFAFKTPEFWLLSLKVLISELIFIYLLFMYKPYGQTFIQDDYFLSSVGAACAISNTVGRLTMGHVKDKLGYKAVSIPLSATMALFVCLMPLTRHLQLKALYGVSVVMAVGAVGSQYALMPSAAQDSFGDKYASINIGFVYMSTVIATVSSALLSQNLTSLIGWDGMIMLIAACAAVDLTSTFFMPSDPAGRLKQRYRQFYLGGEVATTKSDGKKLHETDVVLAA